MERSKNRINIIGAGISGLVAARTLESRGFAPVILEATDRPGGRVKTDTIGGIPYDRGFQVLLMAYPEVQKHLDLRELDLRLFEPGALIFSKGTIQRIGDPVRDPSTLWATLLASIGTIGDKWRIYRLSRALKRKSLADIFSEKERTTLAYLRDLGFSDRVIKTFFRPFFAGIFLEDQLRTSSRMFEFTFKIFSEGYAGIPAAGIGAIARQLEHSLQQTEIRCNQRVRKVNSNSIVMEGGEIIHTDATLVTVPMDPRTGELNPSSITWKRCDNLYFSVTDHAFPEGVIGLVAEEASLINNLYYPFGQAVDGLPVLSVTVVRPHDLEPDALVEGVLSELSRLCGITVVKFLRQYSIEEALPDVQDLRMEYNGPVEPLLNNVYAAGDYLFNGSLNAAMASGEAAANALADHMSG